MHWLKEEDMNTKFFHSMIKARRNSNRIFTIRHGEGNTRTNAPDIAETFVEYYRNLLGTKGISRTRVCNTIVKERACGFNRSKENTDIRLQYSGNEEALWDIAGEKAPGPNGYESQFFKDCWDKIKDDLTAGEMEFFRAGKPLKVWNTTVLTLIPKSDHVDTVGDYMPIACCNTIYKIVSKMLSNRLKLVLPEIISPNQSAFIAGRNIV